jgi:hypothetical protein
VKVALHREPGAVCGHGGGGTVGDLLGARAPRARLRALLAGPAPVVAPGSYDALSARLVEQAGFDVVHGAAVRHVLTAERRTQPDG